MTNPTLTDVLDFANTINKLPKALRNWVKAIFDNPTEHADKLFNRLANDADETDIVWSLISDAVEYQIVNADQVAELFEAWLQKRHGDDVREDYPGQYVDGPDTYEPAHDALDPVCDCVACVGMRGAK